MSLLRFFIPLFLTLCLAWPAFAETKPETEAEMPVGSEQPKAAPLVISLDDAVRIGLQHNRQLEIARLDKRMAGQKVRESWAEVLPHLSSSLTYTRTLKPSVIFLPSTIFGGTGGTQAIEISSDNSSVASLNLNQNIFKLSAFAGIKASGLVREISDESYRNTNAEVVTSIRRAYYDVLIAAENRKLVEQSIARWEQAQRDTDALFRQGVAADIDTLKAWLSVENLKPDLIRARHGESIAATKLKVVMGIEQDTPLALSDSLAFTEIPVPQGVAAAYREALDNRPDVRSLGLQVEAENEKVTAARSEGLPVLSAFGQLQAQTQFDDDTALDSTRWPVSSSVGLQLSVPIFSGFATSSRIEQAKINRLQQRTRYEDLKAQVRADVEVRLSNLIEARKRIDVQSKTIAVAERSYRITRLRLREGIGSRLELTDAELQLQTAKTNYLQAVYDYLIAATELEKSLGRINPPGQEM
ncbi:outer membrane efflux protein [Chlorobaculum parvum NCIB 8327]|uniref:Outer membrane efflux protein n=1 Tax=Chlorobaculum parvum (strain DSM 263 / NCIMB 8327) TaxID=517417 RepID=B3QP65_CHLP8|nr:TolC family protein [Chlorobaculum parvum]ACF11718.1 outer membrane efflux protein [Chlorobaculum parvum NCIB 8327]